MAKGRGLSVHQQSLASSLKCQYISSGPRHSSTVLTGDLHGMFNEYANCPVSKVWAGLCVLKFRYSNLDPGCFQNVYKETEVKMKLPEKTLS